MFLMTLALTLGMTVEQISSQMSAAEMRLWRAYYEVQPFGPDRADYAVALNSMVTAACSPNRMRRLRFDDVMPSFGPKRQQTGKEMVSSFKVLINNLNKTHPGCVRLSHG